ncbi:unnamed protein product [Blepharisma stoltei]|uniref:Uncharacterized protein n=1 Tax=Blepharisma stoltei TaxID=1481888 RepID=A0AAU9KF06_9CILI|nr:unnamed protein product [Blepharisma stoltei]
MESMLLSHKIERKNPIESKYLAYIEKSKTSGFLANIWIYNLETEIFQSYKDLNKISIFQYVDLHYMKVLNLPDNEILLVKWSLSKKKPIIFQFLHKGTRREIYHDAIFHSAEYCDRYVYLFGQHSWKIKISDLQKKTMRRIIKIMPIIIHIAHMDLLSCVGFFDKVLITSSSKNSIILYDKIVNSCSVLPPILRNGDKILAAYQFKIYIILFSGRVYENHGDLRLWNIIDLDICCLKYPNMVTYAYKSNALMIADEENFYSFDLDKVKIEKLNIKNTNIF